MPENKDEFGFEALVEFLNTWSHDVTERTGREPISVTVVLDYHIYPYALHQWQRLLQIPADYRVGEEHVQLAATILTLKRGPRR